MAKAQTPQDHENDDMKDTIRSKFEKMFSGQEPPTYASVREVEAMKARINELETQLAGQSETQREPSKAAAEKREPAQYSERPAPYSTWSPSKASEQRDQNRAQSVTRLLSLFIGAIVLSVPIYLYWAVKTGAWQIYVIIAGLIFSGALIGVAISLVRRNRIETAMEMIIATACFLIPLIVSLISGVGVVLAATQFLIILAIVGPSLSGSRATRALLGGFVFSMMTLLIDFTARWSRLSVPGMQSAIPLIALMLIIAVGFLLVRQFRNYSLRNKLVVTFVAVALLSISTVGYVTSRVATAQFNKELGSSLNALASGLARETGHVLLANKVPLDGLVLNKFIQDSVEEANQAGTSDVTAMNQLDESWAAATDTDALIKQVLENEIAGELRELQRRLPQYAELFVTDKYGAVIASTNRTSDYYQADEAWWQGAWNNGTGGVFISQPEFDESTGIYAVDMALPIPAHNRSDAVGVLRATVNVNELTNVLSAGQLGQTGKALLVFSNNQFLTHESNNGLGIMDSQTLSEISAIRGAYAEFAYEGTPSLVSKSLVVSSTNDQDRAAIENLGWTIVIHQDLVEAHQPVAATTRGIVMTTIGLLIVTGLLALLVGGQFAKPIEDLTIVAEQIEAGNLLARANDSSKDEIGALASTFNRMTGQLRETLTGLEQRVADRTRDLELASEVGAKISLKVGDLQGLLSDATDLIRDRFNLYYTQIYLVDTAGRTLTLRAGTGTVGAALIERGHRLPIRAGSLNGQAASDKKAVIVADTASSASFLPNPLLPKTRSEMVVPLVVGENVLGVLDMQSERPGTFNDTNLPAFEALASQLSIAIQNASLFAEAEQARADVEARTQRQTQAGWQEFLNAIERGEAVGYGFDQKNVYSVTPAASFQNEQGLNVPISITGAKVGAIQLADEADRIWSATEAEIAQATAEVLGNHIDNLRLLAQAEEYRSEAEQAARRLTREGWEGFLKSRKELESGYVYDLHQIRSLSENHNGKHPVLAQPLVVQAETMGELVVATEAETSQEAAEIVAAVAAQLSDHIENLRLLEQTQQRSLELEEAQTFLDSVIESIPNMLFVKDAEELRFLRWNKAAEELVGFSQEEMLGKNDYDFFPQEEADFFTAKDRQVLTEGKTIDIPEESLATPHRGMRIMHTRKAPVYGLDGKPKYLLGVAEDITERKEAEEVLRVSQARLSEALNIARLANWEYDVEKDIFSFNDHFYSIFHTTVEQVGGYELSSADYARLFVHPDDMPIVGSEIGKALASTDRHYSAKLEHRILFADGGMGYIAVDIHIDRDENGKIIRYYGANQDITERKKAEEVVRMAQQRAQIILESVTVPMVITRLSDNHLTFVNQPALDITHFKYEEVIDQPSPNFYVHAEDRKNLISELRDHGRVSDVIVQLRGATGEDFWALLSARTFDYQGEGSILTTFMDITDRIHAQEAVAKRATELATVAEVSTTASTVLDPNQLLQSVVDLTKERFGLYHAHIYMLNAEGNALVLTSGAGEVGRQMLAQGWNIPVDHELSIIADAYRKRQSVVANDVYHDKESTFLSNRLLPDTRSEMAIPMIVGEMVLGVFDVQSDQVDAFTEQEANIYTTLAAQVGVALQNARLFEEIEQQRGQLSDALKSSHLAYWEYDFVNDVFTFNDQFYAILRTTAEREGGYTMPAAQYAQRFVYPEDLGTVGAEIQKAGETTDPNYSVQVDHRIIYADGEVGYFSVRFKIEKDAEGRTIRSYGANQDITERKQAEQIIAQRALQLETVATLSTTASTVLDPDKLLQSVVDLTKERFGLYHAHIYLADESWQTLLLAAGAGQVGRELVAEQHAIPMSLQHSLVARAAREGKAVIVNDVNSEPGFLPNPLLPETRAEMAVPMIVGDKVLGVFDVQSNYAAGFSDEDANIYVTLATQVGVALQNARLYVEQAATVTQLRELDKLKSSFLANMSHELRTPLNSILGFTDVIMEGLDGPLTEYMDNDLRLIQKNGQHLLHLINDVLDMAKIEAGRMNLNPENFRAIEVMEEVTSITSTLASEKNLSLFLEEESDQDLEIYADRTRLRQVMINLVNNAIKFTESGKISLKVAPMQGARVLFTVKDTGIGIAPDKLDAIFQEFTQVDSSTTRKAGGTGLGLPISRRLVEMHGGRLWADSTGVPGEGSIFFVELPLEARITEVVEKQER